MIPILQMWKLRLKNKWFHWGHTLQLAELVCESRKVYQLSVFFTSQFDDIAIDWKKKKKKKKKKEI